jgi:ABC-type dipeptide/oligopeptide/nickel transport system ATPase subunit
MDPKQNYYEVLELKTDASPQEVREAYLRLKNAYGKDSVALYSLVSAQETENILKRVEEAYQVLSHVERRKDYDSGFSKNAAEPAPPSNVISMDRSKSGADDLLDTLPKDYNQVVGKMFDGGVDLSGGQWQKLALARAFFRNAPILILDEPTSAIDAKAEYEIFERVQGLQKDKTVIIISHRFSTVRNADRIVVLEDGMIIEEGTHQTLMSIKGLYAELFNIQAKGYK